MNNPTSPNPDFSNPLAPILRADCSIQYDKMLPEKMEEALSKKVLDDPGVHALYVLAKHNVFRPFVEVFGNIGMDRFVISRDAIVQLLKGPILAKSQFSDAIKRSLTIALAFLYRREPRAHVAELFLKSPDPVKTLMGNIQELDKVCATITDTENKEEQEKCRVIFWNFWEFAWSVQFFFYDESPVELLEQIYDRYPFLEQRIGDREGLQLPGGMQDPRKTGGSEIILF